jgi:hypothetical protein
MNYPDSQRLRSFKRLYKNTVAVSADYYEISGFRDAAVE